MSWCVLTSGPACRASLLSAYECVSSHAGFRYEPTETQRNCSRPPKPTNSLTKQQTQPPLHPPPSCSLEPRKSPLTSLCPWQDFWLNLFLSSEKAVWPPTGSTALSTSPYKGPLASALPLSWPLIISCSSSPYVPYHVEPEMPLK